MNEEAPARLKSMPEASRELAQALEALGQHPADGARIARVEQRLGALLDAPPPTSQAAWLKHALLKSVTGKLLAVGLLAAVGASWLLRSAPAEPVAVAPKVEAPIVAPSPPRELQVEAPALPGPSIVPLERNVVTAHAETELQHSPSRHVRSKTRGPVGTRSNDGMAAHGSQVEPLTPIDTASGDTAERETEAQVKPPVAPPAPAEPPPPPPPPAPSETNLLLSARKQLKAAPADALDLLDKHAALFPRGLLAPEREVLAIEALRKLGRNADADQRLARFRVQYPDSPFLRGLR